MTQKPEEFEILYSMVKRRSPKIIVEIGIWEGETMARWAEISELAIGIDFYKDRGEIFNKKREDVLSKIKNAIIIKGDSHSDLTKRDLEKALKNRKIDFLFIDGDHTYGGAKSDYFIYGEFVRPGGLIALHDVVDSENHRNCNCFVSKLWQEIKGENEIEIIFEPLTWGGIGVIEKS
jgi:predicted O-methyltransferase YrrM